VLTRRGMAILKATFAVCRLRLAFLMPSLVTLIICRGGKARFFLNSLARMLPGATCNSTSSRLDVPYCLSYDCSDEVCLSETFA
jgi:hypothetical protein